MRRKVDKNSKNDYFFNSEITGSRGSFDPPIDDIEDDIIDDDDFDDGAPEPCYMFDAISTILAMDKPFGMLFDIDKIEKFLIARGYKIVDKYFSHINDSVKIAVKTEDPNTIPDSPEGAKYHIRAAFSSEIQDILLKWLLKVSKSGKN